MKKMLYFDVETTGLDPVKNDIIQVAGSIVINGKVMDEFNFKCQPRNWDEISQEALDVHGITIDMLKTYDKPDKIYLDLIGLFSKYIDKYDTEDKFTPAGYNVSFDMDFLKNFFLKAGDVYFGSWVNWRMVDPLPILRMLDFAGVISLPNYKLVTVCEHFGIEIQAHDALSDIKATREVIKRIYSIYIRRKDEINNAA